MNINSDGYGVVDVGTSPGEKIIGANIMSWDSGTLYGGPTIGRDGTPTDNAAMEAINGWIKTEMFTDLHITSNENIENEMKEYITFFNEERPAYSLNYLTPKQYKEYYAQF